MTHRLAGSRAEADQLESQGKGFFSQGGRASRHAGGDRFLGRCCVEEGQHCCPTTSGAIGPDLPEPNAQAGPRYPSKVWITTPNFSSVERGVFVGSVLTIAYFLERKRSSKKENNVSRVIQPEVPGTGAAATCSCSGAVSPTLRSILGDVAGEREGQGRRRVG